MAVLFLILGQAAPYSPPAERSPIVPLLLMVVILGLLLGFGVMLLRSRRRHPIAPGPEARCGRCGYAVTSLTTFTCPECGGDLRVVGIVAATKPRNSASQSGSKHLIPANKTVTIMLTDMQDYTARVATNSREDAMRPLRLQREIVSAVAQRRGGLVVKSTGDGLIVSFDSATDAVLAAEEVQVAVEARNRESFSEFEKFQLRIAVCTGEVAFIENDVFGHPINVASRVQQLTRPGDICFTDSTYHAMNRSEIACEELGAEQVKGIEGKINLYRCVART